MDTPLVTIFTITRNRCDLLPRAMKSILNQTYHNIEYIIIDSASTDDTEKVVKRFNDKRIRYVKLDKNESFGHCINMSVHLATGKYVTELDDDDEYHLDKIQKQVELFESLSEEYGMVYCWMTYYDNQTGKKLREHYTKLKGDVLDETVEIPTVSGTPTLLFRKDVFDKIGGYKESTEIGIESDWEFAARMCRNYKVDYVAESLVNVYINHNHVRMSNAREYYDEMDKKTIVFHNYFLQSFSDVFEKHPEKKWYHLTRLATSNYRLGNFKEGNKFYFQLLRVKPSLKAFILPLRVFASKFFKH